MPVQSTLPTSSDGYRRRWAVAGWGMLVCLLGCAPAEPAPTIVTRSGEARCGDDRPAARGCGDGVVGGEEACDDGGRAAGDGCAPNCQVEDGAFCFGEPSTCEAGRQLIVTSRNSDEVLRFDATHGDLIDVFVSSPESASLRRPYDVVLEPEGGLLVMWFGNGNVWRYDAFTGESRGELYHDTYYLEEPVAAALREDELFVLSNDLEQLVRLDRATGAFLGAFGDPEMRFPHDLVFGPDGLALVVVESAEGAVEVWDVDREERVDRFAPASDGVELAIGVALGPRGNIFLADQRGNQILEYDGDTHQLVGRFACCHPSLREPTQLAFVGTTLWVSTANGILRYSRDGHLLDVFVPEGVGGLAGARGFEVRDLSCRSLVDQGAPLRQRHR